MIFLFGILLTFYVNFLWSLKLDIFFKTKFTSIQIGEIIATNCFIEWKKKYFENSLPTRQNIVKKMRYKKNLKKIFNTKFRAEILTLSNILTSKMNSLDQKMVKYLFSL